MKHIKFFENYSKTIETAENVVEKYCREYPQHSDFFTTFLEVFPDYQSFKDCEYEYGDEDFEDYDEDDDWSPEGEVYMLECEVGSYPGDSIWVDFHNDMNASTWDFNNTPLGQDTTKYNL